MQDAIQYYFNKNISDKIRLQNGWKESWLLTLSDNTKVVFCTCEDYTDFFERERFFYDTVNHCIGKICPEVYVVDGSCKYYNKSFQISEYIDGHALRSVLQVESDDCKKALYYKIGETVARINQIKISSEHPYIKNRNSWLLHYTEKLLKIQLLRIVDNKLVKMEEVEKLCQNIQKRKVLSEYSFLHRDIRPDNIILKDDRLFIIDAETCEFGDPLYELACINLEWHYWEMFDYLFDGYKSVENIDINNELFYCYQLERLAEILDMHYNHGCANSTTPYFENKFKQIKNKLLY